jgi:nucleoside-diphosphate-sugar epimerase
MKVFVAGATGAIGLPLVRVLCALGHEVTGMTRAGRAVDRLRELGARVSHADAFDAEAVRAAIAAAAPDVVIDQMTWLPASPADVLTSLPNDTRLRREGGANLIAAARAAGVKRFVLQSRGFYLDAPAGRLADETARFRSDAPGEVGHAARAMAENEAQLLATPALAGVALRYGFFYGPGTWYRPDGAVAELVKNGASTIIGDGNAVWSFVHLDDAVAATVAALTGEPGIYNVVDDDPAPVREWVPYMAELLGAKPPRRVPVWLGRIAAGELAISTATQMRGSSNAKAKRELGWQPGYASWREGFAAELRAVPR